MNAVNYLPDKGIGGECGKEGIRSSMLSASSGVTDSLVEERDHGPKSINTCRVIDLSYLDHHRGLSPLLALPVDSLHCIASFLSPSEWMNLGQSGRGASHACREVFRRVRMHGFRCAAEIVTAWVRGEYSDARELAALYVSSGVPVYPLCLGHSYQTLAWRMAVEFREMESGNSDGNDNNNDNNNEIDVNSGRDDTPFSSCRLDRFYSGRYEARDADGYYHPGLTFLEEKCLFYQHRSSNGGSSDTQNLSLERRHSLTSSVALRPPFMLPSRGVLQPQQQQLGLPGLTNQNQHSAFAASLYRPPRRTLSSSNLPASTRLYSWSVRPLHSVRVHRHLADMHLLGRPAVNDDDGKMRAAPLSLSADFFHPHFSISFPTRSPSTAAVHPTDSMPPMHMSSRDEDYSIVESEEAPFSNIDTAPTGLGAMMEATMDSHVLLNDGLSHVQQQPVSAVINEQRQVTRQPNALIHLSPLFRDEEHRGDEQVMPVLASPYSIKGVDADRGADVALEVYSSASLGVSKEPHISPFDEDVSSSDCTGDLPLRSLRSRIASYQRKLDSHLAHYQSVAFDECLLDFWDEFLPLTAGVHFHDGHTPVPRMSSLHRFLTQPCPKSLGIVQCEIERIKTTNSKKGVNVKGRLFPSYQYRLFIRDRREDDGADAEAGVNRKNIARSDTVLMTAKNKGKSHYGVAGHSTSASASKRGVNNYFLYMPQDRDIDLHFNSVNEATWPCRTAKPIQRLFHINSGIAPSPREIGRLQSNFIGTEFQIFTPCLKKRRILSRGVSRSSSFDSASDVDVTSTASQETAESLSLSPMRTSQAQGDQGDCMAVARQSRFRRGSNISGLCDAEDGSSSSSVGQQSRRRSWPSLRYSRRAIANMIVDTPPPAQDMSAQKSVAEEENGVITYTANLLGNRPRIMDVCIPAVADKGMISPEWRRHVEASFERGEDETMINRFKQLQQEQIHQENIGNAAQNDVDADDQGRGPSEFGLMALQNRPPWWNAELGAFVLNFGGRVSVASVKNFQLCDRRNQEHVMLQFGRIEGRHSFTMDFQHPLSAVQAFAIAISSLQSKISFG